VLDEQLERTVNASIKLQKATVTTAINNLSQVIIKVKLAMTSDQPKIALCASCDRCRARKTKCDGKRPCGNCAAKYMKKHRLDSIEGIDIRLFECVYSPAKRRGPVPGKAGQVRKGDHLDQRESKRNGNLLDLGNMGVDGNGNSMITKQAQLASIGLTSAGGFGLDASDQRGSDAVALHHRLVMTGVRPPGSSSTSLNPNISGVSSQEEMNYLQQQMHLQQRQQAFQQMVNDMRDNPISSDYSATTIQTTNTLGLAKSVTKHLSLLEKSSVDGNRLRSYYGLSIDDLNRLPPVPSDEEYCSKLEGTMNPSMLARFDLAALRAARFAEIALGALFSDKETLGLELSNATVTCLRQCVEDPVHPSCMYDVARAYYLHSLFRFYRGDLVRYFKYRRVCLSHLSQMDTGEGISAFLAAVSFHDSWAYMLYNANEEALPPIDDAFPPLVKNYNNIKKSSAAETKYKTSTNHCGVINGRKNQMWIQGAPPIFINSDAPPLCRCLDALACAIRSISDKANNHLNFADNEAITASVTSLAVSANEKELCSRNMVLSAFTLLQQHQSHSLNLDKNLGYHLIISAMDAFVEGGDEEEAGGLSDSQIQSLIQVCNTIIEHPYLLYQPGPTYHIVTNAAVLLCHLLNGLHSNRDVSGKDLGGMEVALFDAVLDTFLSVRKILNIHREKLPINLRCHGLPRPRLVKETKNDEDVSFINLGCTAMCVSRACQGFVLMGCSPCVAAERAQTAKIQHGESKVEESGYSTTNGSHGPFQSELSELASELDLDDDALLNVLSKVITS